MCCVVEREGGGGGEGVAEQAAAQRHLPHRHRHSWHTHLGCQRELLQIIVYTLWMTVLLKCMGATCIYIVYAKKSSCRFS